MAPILAAQNVAIGYNSAPCVRDLSIEVEPGEIVALLGPNGAGKTTSLLGLVGHLRPQAGTIFWKGRAIRLPLHRRCRAGLAFVPEERSVFSGLTTLENLKVGGCDVDYAFKLSPELAALRSRPAGLLSGGEQQILTLTRALARRPEVLVADELSLGLAPLVATRLLAAVRQAADSGLGVLLVEQHLHRALAVADRVYVMRQGRICFEGSAETARTSRETITDLYLGDLGT